MEYFLIGAAVVSLGLAFNFKRKHRRLLNTGRVPDIISAHHRANFFLVFAVIVVGLFIIFRQMN
jgi:hypothetical protein